MARDYKHHANKRRRHSRSSGIAPWLGVFAGLLVGLFIAFLVFIKMQAPPVQQVFVKETLPVPQAPAAEEKRDTHKEPAQTATAPPKPRFDFYTLLPEMEVVVPEQEITGVPKQGVREVEKPGTYYLQVGSFKSGEQADRFKAELALMGLETSIQKVTIDNKNTWHRVRVGPYDELDELNKARRVLNRQNIESTLVKIRE